jgi:hypothetical protein
LIKLYPLLINKLVPFQTAIRFILIAASISILSCLQFNKIYQSRFSLIVGNEGDSRFLTVTLENWYQFLLGNTSWIDSPFFFPTERALSFSDALVLFVPIYAPFRMLGVDPLLSFQLAFIFFVSFGFLGMILVGVKLGLHLYQSILIGGILALANGMTIASGHGQLIAVHFLPWLLLIGLHSVSGSSARNRKTNALFAGLLLGLLFFTSFYIAWFTVLIVLMLVLVFLVIFPKSSLIALSRLTKEILLFCFGFVIGLIPFIYTYLPLIVNNVARDVNEIMVYLLFKEDLLNIGGGNFIWGNLLNISSQEDFVHKNTEFMMSPTPLLTLGTFLLTFAVLKKSRYPFVMFILFIFTYSLVFLIGTHTPWSIIFELVPGANAVRAIGRMGLVTNFLILTVTILALVLLNQSSSNLKLAKFLSTTFLVVALTEQFNSGLELNIDRRSLQAWPVSANKDSNCSSFFVMPDSSRVGYAANLDAMIIALDSGVPTLNGYSGVFPAGWNLLDTDSPNYFVEVSNWISLNNLENVCAVTDRGSKWITYRSSG